MKADRHTPVMVDEVLEYLAPRAGMTAFDGTAGEGGHSLRIIEEILPEGQLIVADVDGESISACRERFRVFGNSVIFFHANFKNVDAIVREAGVEGFDIALLDLGVSSRQLDDASRGLSFQKAGPLDMRLDRESHLSAATVVNRWSEKRLAETFHVYGEERHSRRIARGIVRARQRERIETTKDLADVVIRSLPPAVKRSRWRIHPATRVFQAIRIVVNSELENLEMFCSKIFSCLRPGGRVGIISFHSLEDRIVKVAFRDAAGEGLARVITRRPVSASPQEVERNPRSRSAKLRVAERVKEE